MKEMYREYDEKMKKAIAVLEAEYKTLRAGRANPSVLDRLSVDYYGAATPINQLASVSVTEARTLAISPYDASTLKAIEKAILASDIGINPQNDGRTIRLIFPPQGACQAGQKDGGGQQGCRAQHPPRRH